MQHVYFTAEFYNENGESFKVSRDGDDLGLLMITNEGMREGKIMMTREEAKMLVHSVNKILELDTEIQ